MSENKLNAELVIQAINLGMLDEDLDQIRETLNSRRDLVASRKALSLDSGDEFLIVNIKPKMLEGEHVKLLGFDGQWLDCEFISYPPGKYRQGQKVKLRHSHVGAIVHRVHEQQED